MRKTTMTIAACAIAAPMILLANSDRIELKYGPQKQLNKIWIDDVEEMTVLKTQGITEGYNTFRVNFKSGDSKEWLMGAINDMKWVKGLLPSSLEMEAEPHHRCITMYADCKDPDVKYSFGAMPIEYFKGKSENEYHDIILSHETQLINQFAYSLGKDIKDIDPKRIFSYSGENKITWFASTTEEHFAMPGREYIAYIYEGDITGEGLVLNHDVCFQKVTAKTISISDVDYNITYEVTPNFITTEVTASDEGPFCIFLIPEESIDLNNIDAAADAQISTLEHSIYSVGGDGDWDKVTYVSKGQDKSKQLCSGESYYIMAVGCEYGVRTTKPVISEKITVPYPEVTDNCTFEVTAEPVSASELTLNITPSNPDTRYLVYLRESGVVKNPLEFLTTSIYTLRSFGRLSLEPGENNPYVFTGSQTLNSISNCINGKVLLVGTDYTFYVVGVDSYGTPTTEVHEFNYTPQQSGKRMSFEITFDTDKYKAEQLDEKWGRELYYCITPSDPEMKYIFDKTRYSERTLEMSDNEFMDDWVYSYGTNLRTYQGVRDSWTPFSGNYDYEAGRYVFSPYLIFVFGYDGSATSELYMYKFDPETGELTQLRGPGTDAE